MKKEPIVSPSLIKEFDPSRPIPAKLRIGWEEIIGVPINPAHYTGLSAVKINGVDTTFDTLLLQASQQFEEAKLWMISKRKAINQIVDLDSHRMKVTLCR